MHRSPSKITTLAVFDGEGTEVLDELKQVRLASDLKVLRLAVEEESHLVHHVAVEEGKHSAKTEIRSHL